MAAYDDLNVPRIFSVGVISIIITAVTALAVQVLFYALTEWQEEWKSAKSNYGRQEAVIKKQAEQISQYGVDPATGNVTIPIEKAIELIARENKKSNDGKSNKNEI